MKYFILCIATLAVSCTGVRDRMLSDGNTWAIWVKDIGECNGYSSADTCINNLESQVAARGSRICGKDPHRVYGCVKTSNPGVECKVQCEPNVRREIVEPVQPEPRKNVGASKDVLKKAKKCQKKGGVWVNNSCQIILDDDEEQAH